MTFNLLISDRFIELTIQMVRRNSSLEVYGNPRLLLMTYTEIQAEIISLGGVMGGILRFSLD